MDRVTFETGDVVFRQGERGQDCYQVVAGRVEVRMRRRRPDGSSVEDVIASLGHGEIFGEMGVIEDVPRSATVISVEPSVCVRYSRDEVMDMIRGAGAGAEAIVLTLIARLRRAERRIARERAERDAVPPETEGDGAA